MPVSWFERLSVLATRQVLAVLMVVFLVLFLVVFPMASSRLNELSGDAGMIDMQTYYTPSKAFEMVAAYGPEGRPLYIVTTLTADSIFPLDYSLLFALLMIVTYRQAFAGSRLVRFLVLAPLITGGFDLLENACIVTLLSSYPGQPVLIAQLAGLFTSLKWSFVLISVVLVLIGFTGLAAARLRKRPHS